MRKLPQEKNVEALARTVVAMMTPFIGNIKSITTDNGSAFACHKLIAQRLKTKVYFAHPVRRVRDTIAKGCLPFRPRKGQEAAA